LVLSPKVRALLAHLVLLAMMAIPLFGHMDTVPLAPYDEMRLAVNATELSQSGHPIALTFQGKPEFWNAKPPLLIWVQALFLKVFGYNEIAVRLPVAIAAALLCFALLYFLKRHTGSWLPGLIAAGILLSDGPGFISYHAARSGDYDVPLTYFLITSLFCLHNWIEDGRQRWLYYSGAALIAAVLTKGISGFFFCPGMLIYVLIRKKGQALLHTRAFYVCLVSVVVFVGGYYLIREAVQPGYWQAVMKNEIGGRYNVVIEGHGGPPWQYLLVLNEYGLGPWNYLIIPAIVAAFLLRDTRQKCVALLCGVAVVSLILVLSTSSTKIHWYLIPAYPLLAILVALFLWQVCVILGSLKSAELVWKVNFLPFLFLALIAYQPYTSVFNSVLNTGVSGNDEDAKLYIKEAWTGKRAMQANAWTGDPYGMIWYDEVLRIKGGRFQQVHWDSLSKGMKVMAWQKDVKNYISTRYRARVIDGLGDAQVFAIDSVSR
jgi:4-amino-4-deoxy-L-arabinose transferase-like glycosyltransferase